MPEDLSVVPDSLDDHVGKGRLAEVERTCAGLVQEAVECGKRLPGRQGAPSERPIGRQTVRGAAM